MSVRSTESIDVQAFIDRYSISRFQYGVMFLCFLIIAFDGYDTPAMGFIAPTLRRAWGLSNGQINPVLVASLIGLGIGAFASGPVADRYGSKKVLLASVAIFGGLESRFRVRALYRITDAIALSDGSRLIVSIAEKFGQNQLQ